MSWEPELAAQSIEEGMERGDLPESDRDEVRRFSEFLRLRARRAAGVACPLPPEMKDYLLGKE